MCIYSWFIWQYISHPSKMKGQVKDTSDDKSFLDFGPILGEGWLVENCIYHCYSCFDTSGLWTLHFTMYYELCNPKVGVVFPNWQLESQGAIYPYEWCSYYELRASIGGEWWRKQNRLHLESRTPSQARLWTLRYMPSIYGNDIPTGNPGPWMEEPQGSYLDSPLPKRIP